MNHTNASALQFANASASRIALGDDKIVGRFAGIFGERCARALTVHRHRAAGKVAALLVLLTLGLSLATEAHAQTVLVSPGALFDVTEQEAADLVEESAWIVLDQGLGVVRVYELAQIAPEMGPIAACGTDVVCYLPLRESAITHVLITNIEGAEEGHRVTYELVDLGVGVIIASEAGALSSATDFAGLVAPASVALNGIPRVALQPPTTHTGPPPGGSDTTSASTTGYVGPLSTESEPASSGNVRRAGRITAAAGGALVTGGILLGFAADETQQVIQSTPHARDELQRLQDQGRSRQRLANAALITGAVGIVGGITMVLLDRPATDGGVGVRIDATPRMARVRLQF